MSCGGIGNIVVITTKEVRCIGMVTVLVFREREREKGVGGVLIALIPRCMIV
jgi:hypothetical protein